MIEADAPTTAPARGRRVFLIVAVLAIVGLVGVLLSQLLTDNSVLYLEPREALAQRADLPDGEPFRLGGWLVEGSLVETADGLEFEVTDFAETILVRTGVTPPQLFGEDIPVLLDGSFQNGEFIATEVILRHEEEYIPAEGETGA